MKVYKSSLHNVETTEQNAELTAINAFARREMTADEVYTFAVKLCDNEVDRDFERFSDSCLEELALLYVGKTGLLDHNWQASGQMARIYRTEVVTDSAQKNYENQPYKYLKAWAYIPQSTGTEDFINAIDTGIIKETSVGCAVGERTCSICGNSASEGCVHICGKEYNGRLCYAVLETATDAYEWSFVAVPAQKNAGIIKGFGSASSLKELVNTPQGRAFYDEYESLAKQAQCAKSLMEDATNEVSRLCMLWDEEMYASMRKSIETMGVAELLQMKNSITKKLEGKYPALCQLPGADREVRFIGDDYLI